MHIENFDHLGEPEVCITNFQDDHGVKPPGVFKILSTLAPLIATDQKSIKMIYIQSIFIHFSSYLANYCPLPWQYKN
jgi:hypothetical protein